MYNHVLFGKKKTGVVHKKILSMHLVYALLRFGYG